MGNRTSSNDKHNGSGYVAMNIEAKTVNFNRELISSTPGAQASASEPTQHIRPCCVNDQYGKKPCDVFQGKLKQFYSTLTLPKVSWAKGNNDLSIVKHFITLRITESDKSIDIEDIFKPVETTKPTRILVEGQPGFGKTALATKLAFDWATNKKYINYKFAFFIPLRELLQRSIEDVIVQIADHVGVKDVTSAIQMVNYHEQDTIFILDGLDEVSVEKRHEIMKLLYKQIYDVATTVVFCRTGLFESRNEEQTQLFGIPTKRLFDDKRISILGVKSEDAKRQFLIQFLEKAVVDDITLALSSQIDLFDSPLFLTMIPVILEQDETIGKFETKTQFFKKLFNSVLKHSYVKRKLEIENQFDLFSYNGKPNIIQKDMVEFGMSCVQKISRNDFNFDCDRLTEEVYELGFLIRHSEITFFKESRNHYQAFHTSMLEFAAAFALWMNLKSNKSANKNDDLKLTVNHFLDTNGTSLVLPFLVSLMESDLDLVLCQVELYSYLFSLEFEWTAKLVADCSKHSIINSKYLKRILPCCLSSDYTKNNIKPTNDLIKYGIDCGQIKSIAFDAIPSSELVTNENEIRLHLKLLTGVNDRIIAHSYPHCNMRQIFSSKVPFKGTINECLNYVASSSHIESCDVRMFVTHSRPFLVATTKNERFNQIKYRYLRVEIETEFEKQIVVRLVETNQIQQLEFKGTLNINMSDFCCAAARSTDLTVLCLKNCTINLDDLTNNGIKKYKNLLTWKCEFVSKLPEQLLKLDLYNCDHKISLNEAITRTEPSHLDCGVFYLNDIITEHPTWNGFNTIERLVMPFLSPQIHLYQTNAFSAFRNLQILHMIFVVQPTDRDQEVILPVVAKCINNLPIVKLVIENTFGMRLNLFKYMNDLWDKRHSHLKTVQYIECEKFGDLPGLASVLPELLKGLDYNHWDKVNLFASKINFSKIRQYLTRFDVIHCHPYDNLESNTDDFDFHPRFHNSHIYVSGIYYYDDAFSVTRNSKYIEILDIDVD